jgi:HAE1 family hydrophobic/amphiphilic exporter-1
VQGDITTQFRQGDREIPVRVKMSAASAGKISPANISALYVKSPSKAMLQLSQLAQLQPGESSGTILRRDSRRMEVIEIKYADGKKLAVLNMLTSLRSKFLAQQGEAKGQAIVQAPGETLEIEFLEKNHETMESLKGLLLTFVLSSVLIYMIIAAQFESFLQPISVALSIPLMVPGVALALFATGNSISVISGMGVVMLVGIVVSTAIVLYEFILYFREERHVSARSTDLIAMLKKAGEVRIRPIILTQLTTIVADLPTALAIGEGSEFQAPLSIVVVLGLTISTFLTLIYFPALYLAFERLTERLSWRFMQA